MTYTWYLAKIKNGEPAILEKDKFDDLKYFSLLKASSLDLCASKYISSKGLLFFVDTFLPFWCSSNLLKTSLVNPL